MFFPSCTHSLLQLSEQHLDIYWCQQTNSPYGGLRSRAPSGIQPSPSSENQLLPRAGHRDCLWLIPQSKAKQREKVALLRRVRGFLAPKPTRCASKQASKQEREREKPLPLPPLRWERGRLGYTTCGPFPYEAKRREAVAFFWQEEDGKLEHQDEAAATKPMMRLLCALDFRLRRSRAETISSIVPLPKQTETAAAVMTYGRCSMTQSPAVLCLVLRSARFVSRLSGGPRVKWHELQELLGGSRRRSRQRGSYRHCHRKSLRSFRHVETTAVLTLRSS